MRVATMVLGLVMTVAGGASEAADTRQGSSVLLNNRGTSVVSVGQFKTAELSQTAMLHPHTYEYGVGNAMGFLPAQNTPLLPRPNAVPGEFSKSHYHPAQIPLPKTRTLEDHLLTGFVALMLIAYQLRRKHRFLRPHRFGV